MQIYEANQNSLEDLSSLPTAGLVDPGCWKNYLKDEDEEAEEEDESNYFERYDIK